MVAACAGTAQRAERQQHQREMASWRHGALLFQAGRDMFGMLLVALEEFRAGLQQALQFRIARSGINWVSSAPLTVLW